MNKEINPLSIRYFVIARFARVVPLFVVVVLLSWLLPKCGINNLFYAIPDLTALFLHLTLLHGDSALWTIAPEIQFYLLFIVLWIVFAKRAAFLYLCIVSSFILLVFFDFPSMDKLFFGMTVEWKLPMCLPYFMAGVFFGQLYRHWFAPRSLQSGFFLVALLLLPLFYPHIYLWITGNSHGMWKDMGILIVVGAVFFSVVFLVPADNFLLENRVGDFLGKISYSLYLLHLPVLNLMRGPVRSHPGLLFLVYIPASLFVAYLSYLILENPSRRFIRAYFQAGMNDNFSVSPRVK
jgi:peptidoglycan/LPS O-acetylase OafA/YrhL